MEQKDTLIAVTVLGASVSFQAEGLDKPIKSVGRGLKSLFGISKANVNRLARYVDAKTVA